MYISLLKSVKWNFAFNKLLMQSDINWIVIFVCNLFQAFPDQVFFHIAQQVAKLFVNVDVPAFRRTFHNPDGRVLIAYQWGFSIGIWGGF